MGAQIDWCGGHDKVRCRRFPPILGLLPLSLRLSQEFPAHGVRTCACFCEANVCVCACLCEDKVCAGNIYTHILFDVCVWVLGAVKRK